MDSHAANTLLEVAQKSGVDRWSKRVPTEEMKKHFGTSIRAFVEMKRPGKPYAQEVLGEDYEENEELREAHIDFITLAALHVPELVQFWLDHHKEKQ